MLTYTPNKPSPQGMNKKRSWLLLLLVFVWLWPGVLHHDLWTPGEPYLFTTVNQWQTAHWAIPTIFGEINWEASPLYIWLAALCQHLFSPKQMDAYEATRLTNVILIVCTFACIGGSARQLLGRGYGRIAVLILLGCTGILIPAHFINDSIILCLGAAMCWYGFSLANQRIMMASMMLGGGWTVLSLTGSLLWPLLLILVAFSLLLYPQWRHRRYLLVLLISLLCALPLMLIWPLALYQTAANIFNLWWQYHALAPFGGFRHFEIHFSLGYYLKNLLWFAFPAWPLAIWTASRGKLKNQCWGILAIVWLGLSLPAFALLPQQYQDLLVFILPPLAVLGAAQLDALRRGAIAFLNWFGIMAFGFLAVFLWLGFIAMNYGWPAKLAERAVYFSPYYRYDVNYFPVIVACILTPLWLWAITRQHIRGRQAVTNWAAGVLLVWSLLLTLFLPWLDAAKSARPVVQQMQNSLSEDQLQAFSDRRACISINHDNFSTRIAWQQYGWIPLQADNPDCDYRLITRDLKATPPAQWHEIWAGARPREKNKIIALWVKTTATKE
ncbi:glycosyltransferase family 39 protein [Snodgrassella sp. ESL0253]|uniref:ArnT family glycosyltransferase n=1 Tax=Snodgrassella sp. ESL0253 TaxID=2705031 RepID=UPI001583EF48|nr:glycosyltransferase family 39 protein [Snodgrassella sp. ESL0253]NUE67577.1 glycosyltransferase family 39 protein [Snodgrassella sp. ESL0253]